MSQVTLLSVDVSQPIDVSIKNETSSADGDVQRFAHLVEQHMDHQDKQKHAQQQQSGKQSPHEPAKQDVESDKKLESESAQTKNDEKDIASTSAKKTREADSAKQKDNSDVKAEENIDASEESEEAKPNSLNAEQKEQENAQLAAEQAKSKSQALLNLLAASGDLLVKKDQSSSVEMTEEGSNDLDFPSDLNKQVFDKSKLTKSIEIASEKLVSQFTDKGLALEGEGDSIDAIDLIKGKLTENNTVKMASSETALNSALAKNTQITTEQMKAADIVAELGNEQDTIEQAKESEADDTKENNVLKELLATLSQQNGDKNTGENQEGVKKQTLSGNESNSSSDKSIELVQKQETTQLESLDKTDVSESLLASQVLKSEIESSKTTASTESIILEKKTSSRGNVNSGQSEQGNKEQPSKDAQQMNQSTRLEQHIEEQVASENSTEKSMKQTEAIEKSMVAETLAKAQVNNAFNSTKAEVEQINDTANEQLVEQLANRVVKENVQVQKTQLAMETISIYRKDFANEVKEKVMVMINQKLQQVDIQLDPPELGNMHVRVNLQNEQASVSFMVQNLQAKEALEQHIGKLKDMLADSGVDVGNANIEQQSQSSQNEQQEGQASQSGQEGMTGDNTDVTEISVNMVKASALGIDFYA
jgi:flagellar hook-length control protein FliK